MTHVPKLTPAQLAQAMTRLKALNLSPEAKQRIALMLNEAAQGEARHSVDRLDEGRAEDRKVTAQAVRTHFDGVLSRAAAGLAAMTDAEWDELVEDANTDSDDG